jgi:transcriptional regulator with XRE-family HTH domain
MTFTGWQLRAYRQQARITQAQLGEAVQMTRNAIAKIEAQDRVIRDIEVLKALQRVLCIPYEIVGFVPIEDVTITGTAARIIDHHTS